MAEAMGEKSKVYALDHIEAVCIFAKNNILKKHKKFIDDERIIFVT